jgi:hypothetical protein
MNEETVGVGDGCISGRSRRAEPPSGRSGGMTVQGSMYEIADLRTLSLRKPALLKR